MICLLNRSPNEPRTRYTQEYPCSTGQCARCGWNFAEHKRRIARGLTTGEDGLKRFTKTKEGEIIYDSTETT